MGKMICFDLDGTVVDLYGVPDWLSKLRAEDASPYIDAKPLVDMARLRSILNRLMDAGYEIRVISWLAKDSSEEYKAAVRGAKLFWLHHYEFPFDKAHLVAYGTTKADCVRRATQGERVILIDDNKKVRNGWHIGDTIDASTPDWLDELEALI